MRVMRADPADPLARKRLRDIVEVKLIEQRNYVVWRDVKMEPRRPGSGNKLNRAPAVKLPPFDPGQDIVDRWRKALVKKDFDAALNDAQRRSLRICEQENANIIRGTGGTGENEWFTPDEYLDLARRVLGEIARRIRPDAVRAGPPRLSRSCFENFRGWIACACVKTSRPNASPGALSPIRSAL